MNQPLVDISWWTRLRTDQRDRIDGLRALVNAPASEISPFAAANINQWLDKAHRAWCEVNVHEVERYLELALVKFDQQERKLVRP